MKSFRAFLLSSFIKIFCNSRNIDYTAFYDSCKRIQRPYKLRLINKLEEKYKTEFPECTPLVCACQKGCLKDVELFVACHDEDNFGISVAEMLNQEGKNNNGNSGWTALMAAARHEKPDVVAYLLNQRADPNITDSDGYNALHLSAQDVGSTRSTQLLLERMSADAINQKTNGYEVTPLDIAFRNKSPIKNDIVQLLRQYGGKANYFDKNGNVVGKGRGDLRFCVDK
eukprot:g7285.t1